MLRILPSVPDDVLGKRCTTTVDGDVALIALEAVAFLVLFTTALYFKPWTRGP